jgi:hypothetical protein
MGDKHEGILWICQELRNRFAVVQNRIHHRASSVESVEVSAVIESSVPARVAA